jgi:SSS family solute:Na+ symporter
MFWKRTTGHGAFAGFLTGMLAAMAQHGLSLPLGDTPGVHGGFFGVLVTYRSDLAQAFWTAIVALVFCTLTTIVVSRLTKSPDESTLKDLVYSLTPRATTSTGHGLGRPITLAAAVELAAVALSIWFF